MKFSCARIMLCVGVVFSLLASDQLVAALSPKLSLPELVRLALKRSPAIKISEAQVSVSENNTSIARGALLPSISLNSNVATTDNPASLSSAGGSASSTTEEYAAYLEASQPIYSGGALSALSLRRQEEGLKRLELVNETQALVEAVAMAFYQVAEQARLLIAAEQHVDTLKSYALIIGRYEKIGRARKTDRLQALVNLSMAEAEMRTIQTKVFSAKEDLRKLLALENAPDIELPADLLKIHYEQVNLGQVVVNAMQANPNIQISKINLEKIANEKSVALSADMPELKISGQLGYRSPNSPEWLDDTSKYSKVALNLKIPIFSGLTSLATRRAYEQKKIIASRDLEISKFELTANLQSKMTELESTIERLEMVRAARENAAKALELASRDYKQSLISSQDLMGVQKTRYEAEKLFVNTQFVYFKTLLMTRRQMGVALEKIYAEK